MEKQQFLMRKYLLNCEDHNGITILKERFITMNYLYCNAFY